MGHRSSSTGAADRHRYLTHRSPARSRSDRAGRRRRWHGAAAGWFGALAGSLGSAAKNQKASPVFNET